MVRRGIEGARVVVDRKSSSTGQTGRDGRNDGARHWFYRSTCMAGPGRHDKRAVTTVRSLALTGIARHTARQAGSPTLMTNVTNQSKINSVVRLVFFLLHYTTSVSPRSYGGKKKRCTNTRVRDTHDELYMCRRTSSQASERIKCMMITCCRGERGAG